jgi:hypothetical protein
MKGVFRKEVMKRLERLEDRLMVGDDPERFEVAMLLNQLMKRKELPWGIVGLILAIYERSINQDFEDLKVAEEILSDVSTKLE